MTAPARARLPAVSVPMNETAVVVVSPEAVGRSPASDTAPATRTTPVAAAIEAAARPASQPPGWNASPPSTIERKMNTAIAVASALWARLKTTLSGRWRR